MAVVTVGPLLKIVTVLTVVKVVKVVTYKKNTFVTSVTIIHIETTALL